MQKKKILFLNYYFGSQLDYMSPVFYGNSLYWLKAYLETSEEITGRYDIRVVNFEHMNFLNRSVAHEGNINVLNAVLLEQPDMVAFSLYVWNVVQAAELAANLKQMAPDMTIIAGGPEVHEREEFCQEYPEFDVVVEGDGEVPLKAVLLNLADGRGLASIPNVSYREGEGFVHNRSRTAMVGIEEIPDFYKQHKSLVSGWGFYLTTRGCPNNCDMCLWAKQPMRKKSPERILEELESIVLGTEIQFLTLFDYDLLEIYEKDNSMFRRLEDIVRRKGDGFGINFFINPDYLLSDRLRDVLERLNSKHVFIGLQSMCVEALYAINRGWSVDSLHTLDELDDDLREHCVVQMMFPLPEETPEHFIQTLKRLLEMGYFRMQVFLTCVLRGTRLRRRASERGMKFHKEPPYFCYETPTVTPRDWLRVGVLSYVMNMLENISSAFSDRSPFVRYFRSNHQVVDRILAEVDASTNSEYIIRNLVKDILGIEYTGIFGTDEYRKDTHGKLTLLQAYEKHSGRR